MPEDQWPEFKARAIACYQAASPTLARLLRDDMGSTYGAHAERTAPIVSANVTVVRKMALGPPELLTDTREKLSIRGAETFDGLKERKQSITPRMALAKLLAPNSGWRAPTGCHI